MIVRLKENVLWWRIFHLKRILERLLSNSGLKQFCACFYHPTNILSKGTKSRARKQSVVFLFENGKAHFRYTVCSWFLKKVSWDARFFTMLLPSMQKNSIFSTLRLKYLHMNYWFNWYDEHVCTYRGEEFQNILESKL